MNRMFLIKTHMYLAAFIFPVALMFLITGGLYTWEIKGSYISQPYIISLQSPLTKNLKELQALTEQELEILGVPFPSGSAKIKKGGTSFKFEWTGSARDVVLEPTSDRLAAKLIIKETTWYRQFVQLHKAKGGQLFKIYAAILALALFSILLTGFVMAWQIPKYRRSVISFTVAGIVFFVLMIGAS